jgi:Family of unknown function (DUF6283)
MSKVRPLPCEACPYRRDVPSGLWAEHEYDKLVEYDRPTGSQPFAAFACHASPEALCHGWAVTHTTRGHEFDLLALRLEPQDGPIPAPVIPLFASGSEAAEHGKTDLDAPSAEAKAAVARLQRKHPRLRDEETV